MTIVDFANFEPKVQEKHRFKNPMKKYTGNFIELCTLFRVEKPSNYLVLHKR